MTESLCRPNLRIYIARKFYRKLWNVSENLFTWNPSLKYADVWNRSEIFWKLKINQGVKTDYNDRISKLTKIEIL